MSFIVLGELRKSYKQFDIYAIGVGWLQKLFRCFHNQNTRTLFMASGIKQT